MTFHLISVEVTHVTLPKDHCVQVPWEYINVCGYNDQFCKVPHTTYIYTTYIHTAYYIHTTYRMSDHIVSFWTRWGKTKNMVETMVCIVEMGYKLMSIPNVELSLYLHITCEAECMSCTLPSLRVMSLIPIRFNSSIWSALPGTNSIAFSRPTLDDLRKNLHIVREF